MIILKIHKQAKLILDRVLWPCAYVTTIVLTVSYLSSFNTRNTQICPDPLLLTFAKSSYKTENIEQAMGTTNITYLSPIVSIGLLCVTMDITESILEILVAHRNKKEK